MPTSFVSPPSASNAPLPQFAKGIHEQRQGNKFCDESGNDVAQRLRIVTRGRGRRRKGQTTATPTGVRCGAKAGEGDHTNKTREQRMEEKRKHKVSLTDSGERSLCGEIGYH
uniref:Uncharacterized protein n=1 Tax=Odontella aurita TaxID=265563 RepID=A0A7S4NBI7_9STRA|mmetsp:Transcript_56525/g.169075  ORF Transcript_56525/g.169075 Transcript_56525/m.169075 type:complete len:112 (+) Transcript_56525:430-765(+)